MDLWRCTLRDLFLAILPPSRHKPSRCRSEIGQFQRRKFVFHTVVNSEWTWNLHLVNQLLWEWKICEEIGCHNSGVNQGVWLCKVWARGTGVFFGQSTLACLFAIICPDFFVLFLQSIEFRFDFMLFSESNTMKERRRAWIALHLHLNHGPDRKPEGEPSFIMNAVLQNRPSNVRIFVILPVFLWFSARSER